MSTNFQKKTSSIFLTLLIGLIVISFAITGYQGGSAPTTTIAKVGDQNIEVKEFQNGLNNLLRFYAQIYNGGKDLSSAQIKNMQIRQRVLGQLIDQKLLLILSKDLGIEVSDQEIKEEIKEFSQNGQKVFYTGDVFDLEKYKALLAANGLTPTDFEEETRNRLEIQKVKDLLLNFPISNKVIEKVKNMKESIAEAQVAYFSKASLQKLVPVTPKEIKDYMANEENLKKVQQQFERSKASFSKPERVNASHILIKADEKDAEKKINDLAKKVTAANFKKLADQHTQDPSGKGKGGRLGWFEKGRMVPEFEKVAFSQGIGTVSKPVKTQFGWHLIYVEGKSPAYEATFDNHKDNIAKEIIQGTKPQIRDQIVETLKSQIVELMNKRKLKDLKTLATKNSITFNESERINLYDGLQVPMKLKEEQIKAIFNENKTHVFEDVVYTVIVNTKPVEKLKDEDKVEIDQLTKEQNQSYAFALNNELQKIYKDKTSIKVYRNVAE